MSWEEGPAPYVWRVLSRQQFADERYRRLTVAFYRGWAARNGYRGRVRFVWGPDLHGRQEWLVEMRVYAAR